KSPHTDNFVLKGALMLPVWEAPLSRPTIDIDLLGRTDNSIEAIAAVTKDICLQEVEPDGIAFDVNSIEGVHITEDADYEGVRVRFRGCLETAQFAMQLDIGFGDVVVPSPELMDYPTILDLPGPELRGYSRESTIAEKFEAMVKLGILNSRMKDFFDIWLMSRHYDFDGRTLTAAIAKTFSTRGTDIPSEPTVLSNSFTEDATKAAQWRAFIRRNRLANVPNEFGEILNTLVAFLGPIAKSLAADRSYKATWKASGPWRE
ncbi:MAG: nucleotidyl transferase AbiEii/AbiGii toxin family protein, partial [Planctomycetota bacterium]